MQVGDLVWCRRELSTVGIIIEILSYIGEAHYRVHWSDGVPDSLEFEYDLVTKEERLNVVDWRKNASR